MLYLVGDCLALSSQSSAHSDWSSEHLKLEGQSVWQRFWVRGPSCLLSGRLQLPDESILADIAVVSNRIELVIESSDGNLENNKCIMMQFV